MNLTFPCLKRARDRPADESKLIRFMRDMQEPATQMSYGIGNGSNLDGASWDRDDYLDCARNLGMVPV